MKIYSISSNVLRVRVLARGATLYSIEYYNGKTWQETVSQYASIETYTTNPYYLNSFVGPHAGRVKNGKYSINGKNVEMEVDSSGNHLHGASHGFSFLDYSGTVLNNQTLEMHAYDAYHDIDLIVLFTVVEDQLIIEYKLDPRKEQVLNPTQHTYFNLDGSSTVRDHLLKTEAVSVYALDESGVPDGSTLTTQGTSFDFIQPQSVGNNLEIWHDQFRISKNIDHPFITATLKLESNVSKIGVEVSSDAQVTVLYAANYWDEAVLMKGDVPAQEHGALAVEPQEVPNGVNIKESLSQIYGPQKPFRRTITYRYYTF